MRANTVRGGESPSDTGVKISLNITTNTGRKCQRGIKHNRNGLNLCLMPMEISYFHHTDINNFTKAAISQCSSNTAGSYTSHNAQWFLQTLPPQPHLTL